MSEQRDVQMLLDEIVQATKAYAAAEAVKIGAGGNVYADSPAEAAARARADAARAQLEEMGYDELAESMSGEHTRTEKEKVLIDYTRYMEHMDPLGQAGVNLFLGGGASDLGSALGTAGDAIVTGVASAVGGAVSGASGIWPWVAGGVGVVVLLRLLGGRR